MDNIKEQSIYLKVVVDKLTRSFYYSYDGEQWELAGVLENCIYLCDEGVPDDRKRHLERLLEYMPIMAVWKQNSGRF